MKDRLELRPVNRVGDRLYDECVRSLAGAFGRFCEACPERVLLSDSSIPTDSLALPMTSRTCPLAGAKNGRDAPLNP